MGGDVCVNVENENAWTDADAASPLHNHHHHTYCRDVRHLDGYMTYAHATTNVEVSQYSPALDSVEFQHSAGMGSSYDIISDLVQVSTGNSCVDKCSATNDM